MKILIVSDTHGKHEQLKHALSMEAPIDRLIHLGDVEGCENEIRTMALVPTDIVAGNNDYFSQLSREKELRIGRYHILITHGHQYRVSVSTQFLMQDAMERGFDIVMFGHTHRPLIEYGRNIVAVNPGSLSYPRQENHSPSYLTMELDGQGEAHFVLHYLGQGKE